MVSEKRIVSQVGNRLVHGRRSEHFQNFLKTYGLDLKDLDIAEPSFVEKMKLKLKLMHTHSEVTKVLLAFYKGTGARGLTMYDRLINLKSQILEREELCKENNIDPLTDKALQEAYKQEFEIVKFLERIKYDKEKTELLNNIKDVSVESEDIAFIREE